MKTPSILALSFVALVCLVAPSPISARIWHILPDGSGDAPTIQAGIDSASTGDIVEVACKHYNQSNIHLKSGITLRSETGEPDCVTLVNHIPYGGYVLWFMDLSETVTIKGFTITGGVMMDHYYGAHGAGLFIVRSPVIVDSCDIMGNEPLWKGGVAISGCDPVFINCCIFENTTSWHNSGIHTSSNGSFTAIYCYIGENIAPSCPDGSVRGFTIFACSDFDLDMWCVGDLTIIEDKNECGALQTENSTWGSLKALYR